MSDAIEDIKPGWFVEIMHGDWVETSPHYLAKSLACVYGYGCHLWPMTGLITDIRTPEEHKQAQSEPSDGEMLNWLLERGVAWRGCYDETWLEGEWIYREHNPRQAIREAMQKGGE